MKLLVTKYVPEQGKSCTTEYEIKSLSLDQNTGEVTAEVVKAGGVAIKVALFPKWR